MAFSAIKSISFTSEELLLLDNVLGLLYREGGSCSPRPEGWTDEEWAMRSSIMRRIGEARDEARRIERQVKDECGCELCTKVLSL